MGRTALPSRRVPVPLKSPTSLVTVGMPPMPLNVKRCASSSHPAPAISSHTSAPSATYSPAVTLLRNARTASAVPTLPPSLSAPGHPCPTLPSAPPLAPPQPQQAPQQAPRWKPQPLARKEQQQPQWRQPQQPQCQQRALQGHL